MGWENGQRGDSALFPRSSLPPARPGNGLLAWSCGGREQRGPLLLSSYLYVRSSSPSSLARVLPPLSIPTHAVFFAARPSFSLSLLRMAWEEGEKRIEGRRGGNCHANDDTLSSLFLFSPLSCMALLSKKRRIGERKGGREDEATIHEKRKVEEEGQCNLVARAALIKCTWFKEGTAHILFWLAPP